MALVTPNSSAWKRHGLSSTAPERQQHQPDDDFPSPRALRASNSGRLTSRHEIQGDRFIPVRRAMSLDLAHFSLNQDAKENAKSKLEVASPLKEEYKRKLARKLFQSREAVEGPKILAFKTKAAGSPRTKLNPSSDLTEAEESTELPSPTKFFRRIPPTPERVLDAPELVDDYYLNLLDWSCKNVVAVALGTTVYLWHADTGAIHQLMSTFAEDDYISSLAWAPDGEHIALGFNSKELQLWDATQLFQMRRLKVHSGRVGSLAWNGSTLSSGGRDSLILNHDETT